MKKISVLLAGLFIASCAFGQDTLTFTATNTGLWEDESTWRDGMVPEIWDGDQLYITNGATVTLSSNAATGALGRSFVGPNGQSGSLYIANGGSLMAGERFYVGDRGTGTLTVASGGLLTITTNTANSFYIGAGQAANDATGTVVIEGGEIRLTGSAAAINIGSLNAGSSNGTLIMYSGTFSSAGTNNSIASVSSSTGGANRAQIGLYGGTFSLAGTTRFGNPNIDTVDNAAVVTVSSKMDTVYFEGDTRFQGNTTLSFLIEGGSDFSSPLLNAGMVAGDNNSRLRLLANTVVEADFSKFTAWEGAQAGDTLTITLAHSDNQIQYVDTIVLRVVGLDEQQFSAGEFTWEKNNPDNGYTTDLTIDITYLGAIPEPATAALLLGLVGLCAVLRRRKSA